jgi:transposase
MTLRLRDLTDDERTELTRRTRSRTDPVRTVERAQMVCAAAEGLSAPRIAQRLGVDARVVRTWVTRFNDRGLAGLEDEPRSGRPPTYTPEQVAEVIATSLTKPDDLDQPFGSWTLDRLTVYLNDEKGIPIKRSRIGELLVTEGLRWRTQETWFGERVDPEFVQKRGPSSACAPARPPAA